MTRGVVNTPESFWALAVRDGPCLIFAGASRRRGYGRVSYQGRAFTAHRLAWILSRGPIPDGLFVCHTCDRKLCVEPLHLFLGTSPDNTRDHVAKGRAHLNGRPGLLNSQGRLTPEQVAEIRELASTGLSRRAVAARFGIAHQTVTKIVNRERRVAA